MEKISYEIKREEEEKRCIEAKRDFLVLRNGKETCHLQTLAEMLKDITDNKEKEFWVTENTWLVF